MENKTNSKTDWIRCPVCGGKTREKVRMDTVLENFPLFCPKCKHETIVNVWYFVVSCVGLLVGTAIQKLISLHLLRGEKK